MEEMRRRKGPEIPPFGYWDHSNEFPITQYFESARQTGLLRSHSLRKEPTNVFELPPSSLLYHYPQRTKAWEKRHRQQQVEEQKLDKCWQGEVVVKSGQMKQRRVCDLSHAASQGMRTARRNPRAVDEDLYKIPPELLNQGRGKRVVLRGLWRKCRELNCIS